jgi:hypothetical protein
MNTVDFIVSTILTVVIMLMVGFAGYSFGYADANTKNSIQRINESEELKKFAIDNNLGYYDAKTGAFTWNLKKPVDKLDKTVE